MIRLNNLSKSFGGDLLLGGVTWHIRPGDKVGLVGPNGAGKTTLLNIIAGVASFDDGERILRNALTTGFLRQESDIDAEASKTLLEEVLERGRPDLSEMKDAITRLTDKMENCGIDTSYDLAHKLSDFEENFSGAGGYSVEAEAKSILAGLGFSVDDLSRSIAVFSGGWRMRAELGALLLRHPDLLLLDEPTNHLDLESTVWLESFLKNYKGAIVIISHDRYFLNRMVNQIADIEFNKLTLYNYPFDRYLVEKEARKERLESQATRQQKEIAKQERFIERFGAKNTKATAAKSKMKALEKIERIEVQKDNRSVAVKFKESVRMPKQAVSLMNVTCGYGQEPVYRNLDFTLERGDRVALAGPNGAGKSTLLKIISGAVEISEGKMAIGPSVKMRYFAQRQTEELNQGKSVIDEVYDSAPTETMTAVRTTLGSLGLTGDNVSKKIKVLSGGEKSRVAMAKIALSPSNLLLLDEPTNHLDLLSRQALEKALSRYGGAILLISHDRAFIDSVATKVVHVENGVLTEYLGDYAYYEKKRKALAAITTENSSEAVATPSKLTKKKLRQEAAKARREQAGKVGTLKKNLATTEKEIAGCEERISDTEAELSFPEVYKNQEKTKELNQKLADARKSLPRLMEKWETLSEKIDRATAEKAE